MSKKVVDIIKESDYSEDEREFLNFFWSTLKEDYFQTLKYRMIWLPDVGTFYLKKSKIKTRLRSLLKRIRHRRKLNKPNDRYEKEFRLLWEHLNKYKNEDLEKYS